MKKHFFQLALMSVILMISLAAVPQPANTTLSVVLEKYYRLKDQLVSGNATQAGLNAAEFVKAVNAADLKSYTAEVQKKIRPLLDKLLADAGNISNSKDIEKQRQYFATLSENMILLAREATLSDKEIYVDYCPMKKNSWLSADRPIRNPYYGKAMLTCGRITDTITP